MTTEGKPQTDAGSLEIALDRRDLPVSGVSSLLRVLQASLREVARGDDGIRHWFSRQPQPVLHMSADIAEEDLVLRFAFVDPADSTPLTRLSSDAFSAFFSQFSQLLKGLPQRGLWGESVGGARRRDYPTEVARRLDQVRLELRRFPRGRVVCGRATIQFEGDRMQID